MRLLTAFLLAMALVAGTAERSAAQDLPDIKVSCNAGSCAGWFTSPVTVDWTVAGHTSSSGCVDRTLTAETAGSAQGCIAENAEGSTQATITVRIDRTAPVVTAAMPARPPDHDGWYTAPVTVAFSGSDALSGVASCTAGSYAGGDSGAASVAGTCTDVAGNRSAPFAFPLRYDATPPSTAGIDAQPGDRSVELSLPGDATATVVRTPGIRGEAESLLSSAAGTTLIDRRVANGTRYDYRVTLTDQAGNDASRTLRVVPGPRLREPAAKQQLAAPPLLRWTPVRGARYYNVQLKRGGKKILSRWPGAAQLQLPETWRFKGRRHRLKPGRYRWVVWPGKGPRSDGRYGPRIGARSFVIVAPPA